MTLLAAAFIVGVVVGGGALGMAVRSGKADWVWRLGRGNARPGREDFATRLSRQLKLAPAQKDSIAAIYKRATVEMDSIMTASFQTSRPMRLKIDTLMQPFRASVDSSRTKMRADIRAVLAAPQQQSFDSMMKAVDDARRKQREAWGAGGPGGQRGGNGPGAGSGAGRGGPGGAGQPGGGLDRGPF
jgi:hypothetical protein